MRTYLLPTTYLVPTYTRLGFDDRITYILKITSNQIEKKRTPVMRIDSIPFQIIGLLCFALLCFGVVAQKAGRIVKKIIKRF